MQPQPPRQPTVQDILNDLPNIQQIAARPAAQNPMLAALLQQAAALDQIAGWAATCQQVVAQAALPPIEAPAVDEHANGHAELPKAGEVVTLPHGRRKGGDT